MAGRDLVRVRDYERETNVAGLLNSLDSDSNDARGYAVCALGRLRVSNAIPRVEDLVRDPDKMVRMYACDVLGVLGATDAESQLVGALKDPDAVVREAAAGALCRIRTEANISRLRNALRPVAAADSVADVRFAAVESLLVLGDRTVIDQVPEVVRRLPWRVRRFNPRVTRVTEAAESGGQLSLEPPLWDTHGAL